MTETEIQESECIGKALELIKLATAIRCFTKNLTAEEVQRLHHALMFKGPALEAITKIVKGELR